ncbi:hypothetical protein AQUCO_04500079v1 [Aquilegia coerulea]|uniref:PGG domain-containing protein n=1 Tax=Aquilegia coerulea TaxID=218851 RepID=A0A2G5CLN4_AQUCA|nr:hypothetical protein AQUCO_04500079v1 [Aquilegia coerulea]
MDLISAAAKRGDKEFFSQVELDVLRDYKNENGHSALSIAAVQGSLGCCEEILKRCPSLLYQTTGSGNTALHQAAWEGKLAVMKLLISANANANATMEHPGDIENDITPDKNNLLTMVNFTKSTALHNAVRQGHLELAKLLMQADPSNKLLGMVDKDGDTAMHDAVQIQSLALVKLLVEANPGYVYSVNVNGYTPLFLALKYAFTGDPGRVEIRKHLIEKQPSQCKIPIGRDNWTLLHHAASKGDLSSIEDIINFCPECLNMVDNDLQNFLHLAVKFDHVNVVKDILEMPTIADEVLNGQDNHGNTPLHIAAIGQNARMAKFFLYDSRVSKTIENMQGQKAVDVINFDYDQRRAGVYGLIDIVGEKEIKDRTDFDLLVGALIATVSFAAGITAPGGYTSDGSDKGTAILAKNVSFKIFVISNTIALLLSLYAVFSHFCVKHLHKKADIIYQLNVATYCSFGAIFAMVVAFITGSYAVLAVTEEFSITVCVLCCCFFIFAFRALWRMITQEKPSFLNTWKSFLST